ncbi:MAG: MG2 domain-containing protein, partial [Pseudomonadota bacterium]
MHSKKRSLAVFLTAAFIAASFSLCQKGPREVTTSMESVVVDETPIEFDVAADEGRELPRPPKLYVGDWMKKGEKPQEFEKAQNDFEKKTYKTALEKYAAFVKDDPANYWAAESRIQMARCHYQLSEFDEALDALLKFLESKPGLLWEARVMATLSDLYLTLPYSGYERDGKVYYNYEDREGEYRTMSDENRDTAVSFREKARLAYMALLAAPAAKRGASPGDDLKAEAVTNNLIMVETIENMYWTHHDRCPPAEPLDPPAPGSVHDPDWTTREKILFLLDEVNVFNQGRNDRHPEAWAGFKKALFLMRFSECAPAAWLKKEEKERKQWDEKHKDAFDPDPYRGKVWEPPDALHPVKILSGVIKKYPDDQDTDLFFATKGRALEGRGKFIEAKKVYEKFLEKFPKSKWEDDVQSSLHEMQRPKLETSTDGIGYSGEDDVLTIYTTNIKKVDITIYEIDLPKILMKSKVLKKPYANFSDTYSTFKDFKGAKKYCKKKVRELSYTTRDRGDYLSVYGKIKLPELPKGTYLVHGRADKVEYIDPLIKTDMIIVGKPLADSVQYLVTSSDKGKPLPGVPLVIKETYYDYSVGYNRKVKVTKTQTDSDGRATCKFTRGNDISSNSVQVLAHQGKRMAITGDQYASYYYRSETDETFKIFTTTDRPVYRPGDTVRFKHIVRSTKDGKNNNVPGVSVKMEVTNTKGERIFQKAEKTTSFGTAWGEIRIEDDAPLGVYNARAYVEGSEQRSYQSSGSQFRVEEYKKPEFEVKVEPQKPLAAAGEKVSALIKATYYWGAPVTGGKVKYHVYRSVYWHRYTPPDKWDWLYGSGFGIIYDHPYAGGEELLSDGEGVTDDLGMMEVTLPEMEEDAQYDFEYRVTAEVTDLSRRTIEGAGSVKFTRDPFYVHIVTPLSFYTENDKVEAEILAMTADDEPVPAKGTVEIVRMSYPAAEEEKEEIIKESKIEMDEKGRAFYKFQFKDAGQYKFRFRGKHKGNKVVEGERLVTVAGKQFDKKRFRFSNIEIVSQRRTYERGEEVKVLVATPWEDATIWLSHEGGSEILYDTLEQPQGGSYVMTFKAEEKHQPNFFVRAIVVRENRVHTLERELFIPPREGILEAKVESNQAEYKPREKGSFTITVSDHKGKPVQGEFSMSVFDSSVLYIQAETGGDVRSYYYGDRRY